MPVPYLANSEPHIWGPSAHKHILVIVSCRGQDSLFFWLRHCIYSMTEPYPQSLKCCGFSVCSWREVSVAINSPAFLHSCCKLYMEERWWCNNPTFLITHSWSVSIMTLTCMNGNPWAIYNTVRPEGWEKTTLIPSENDVFVIGYLMNFWQFVVELMWSIALVRL